MLVSWTYPARVVYGELRLRETAFVEAARALGAGTPAPSSAIVPQLGVILLIYFTLNAATMVLLEAGLGFLGFGVQPPTPWGAMINQGRDVLFWPWLMMEPGICLALLGTRFYLVGTGVAAGHRSAPAPGAALMGRYLLRRAGAILLTLLVVATITFALTVLIPADPARTIVGPKGTPEQVAQVRQRLGLDDPLPVQYARYLSDVARFDFGYSYGYRRDVRDILLDRLPYTAILAAAALVVQFGIGVPLGLLHRRPRRWRGGPEQRSPGPCSPSPPRLLDRVGAPLPLRLPPPHLSPGRSLGLRSVVLPAWPWDSPARPGTRA